MILVGEHLGAYGGSALAVPLPNRRTHVRVERASTDRFESPYPFHVTRVFKGVDALFQSLSIERFPITIECQPGLPPGCGGGLSASFALAFMRALGQLLSLCTTPEQELSLLDRSETFFHGTSSGIDAQAIFWEKPVLLQEKVFTPLEMTVPPLTVFSTGTPDESTSEMVQLVRKNYDEGTFAPLITKTKTLCDAASWGGITPGILNQSHALQHTLGVVPPAAHACVVALQTKGLGAKITGAGGITAGGLGLALSDAKQAAEIIQRHGFSVL